MRWPFGRSIVPHVNQTGKGNTMHRASTLCIITPTIFALEWLIFLQFENKNLNVNRVRSDRGHTLYAWKLNDNTSDNERFLNYWFLTKIAYVLDSKISSPICITGSEIRSLWNRMLSEAHNIIRAAVNFHKLCIISCYFI